jgi:hypothetical protein
VQARAGREHDVQDKTSGKIVRGFEQRCTVALVDRERQALLEPFEIGGGIPMSGPPGQDLVGDRPRRELADAIASLERIPPGTAGPSPVLPVVVHGPQGEPAPQQAELEAAVAKAFAARKSFAVTTDRDAPSRAMVEVSLAKTKKGAPCRAGIDLDVGLAPPEMVSGACFDELANRLVDTVAARLEQQLQSASSVACR